ncbi:MAG: hypothetical protein HZB25_13625 [Candidatus Eisenbacteria bacterium]|nr:hypothetical protein [Candidatus Eisenbacteria bacterium]
MRLVPRLVPLLLLIPALASAASLAVPGDYARARLITANGRRVELRDVRVSADSVRFQEASGAVVSEGPGAMDVAGIRFMEVSTGNKAGTYALYGFLTGLTSGISASLSISNTNNSLGNDSDVNAGLIIGVTTALCTGIGALVGMGSTNYSIARADNKWIDGLDVHAGLLEHAGGPLLGVRVRLGGRD